MTIISYGASFGRMLCLAILSLLLPLHCATLKQSNPKNAPPSLEPQPPPMPSAQGKSGDEAQLHYLQQFQQRIVAYCRDKNFTAATRELVWLEQAMANVAETTQAHPDFEDVAKATTKLRPYVDRAIAQDQATRRQAAIEALLLKGNNVAQDAAILLRDLDRQPVEGNDLTTLSDLIALLADNDKDGQPFLQDQRYAQHAQKQQQLRSQLEQRLLLEQQSWLLQQQLQQLAAKAKTIQQRSEPPSLASLRQWSDIYRQCKQQIASAIETNRLPKTTRINGLFGVESMEQSQLRCEQAYLQAEQRLARFDWEQAITQLITPLERTWPPFEQAQTPTEKYPLAVALLPHLQQCVAQQQLAVPQSNRDSQMQFLSPFGPLTSQALLNICRDKLVWLEQLLPKLHWQMDAAQQMQRLPKLDFAAEPSGLAPAEQNKRIIGHYTGILGAIQSCLETCQALATHSDAQLSFALPTPIGAVSLTQLQVHCSNLQQRYQSQLAERLKQQQTSNFLPTCKGDEIAIVEQEGVPSVIVPTELGRTFIYLSGQGQERRRVHFDNQGMRQQLELLWQQAMAASVEALQVAMQTLAHPELGQQEQAWQQALTVLERCQQEGPLGSHHPGYQAGFILQTWFGPKTYPALRQACAAEATKLRQEASKRAWQQRVEQAYKRYLTGMEQSTAATATVNLAAKIDLMQQAQGSFLTCADALLYLQQVDAAIPNYQVVPSDGTTKLAPLRKRCQQAQANITSQLQPLRQQQQAQIYALTLQGDEKELCLQRGVPDLLQNHARGKIWLYGKQRFAFTTEGQRTNEQAIGPSLGPPIRPESPK